ncbi:MAG: iron ABC transporter substrate-binding protein [Spirochaetales bacterium]|nr:iron ABC transporter substrate-binding protein [Spirochaetales bacterium]
MVLILFLVFFSCTKKDEGISTVSVIQVKDSMNREITIPESVKRIICSGAGALRYITYMQCQDRVIAVDDIEKERQQFDARPYAFANPQFHALPLFGEFRGYDNPELIAALSPQPDLIFKTYAETGFNPEELQEKTSIPVCVLDYGDLGKNKSSFYTSLEVIGKIMKKEQRTASLKQFIDALIDDLDKRTEDIKERKTCFVGGIAYRGPHGLQSTEPGYPPFRFLNTNNAAIEPQDSELSHMDVSKEKIVEWDPDIIFIDLATLQTDPQAHALYELQTDPAYKSLKAVVSGEIYGVLPYNSYSQNHGSTLANAYYIGKVLYPDRFTDIDPVKKADEIYEFLVGVPAFEQMNESFHYMAFKKLEF